MKALNTEELKKILKKILEDADKLDQKDEDTDEEEEDDDELEDEDEDEEDELEEDEDELRLRLCRAIFVNSMIDWILSLPYFSKNSKDYIRKNYSDYSKYLCKVIENKVEPKIYEEGKRFGYKDTFELFEAAAFYLLKYI